MVWNTSCCGFSNTNNWPKDFPVVIRKIGNWTGSIKRYFSDIQKDVTDLKNDVEDDISLEEKYSKDKPVNKKNEW